MWKDLTTYCLRHLRSDLIKVSEIWSPTLVLSLQDSSVGGHLRSWDIGTPRAEFLASKYRMTKKWHHQTSKQILLLTICNRNVSQQLEPLNFNESLKQFNFVVQQQESAMKFQLSITQLSQQFEPHSCYINDPYT